jgi:hypothetical protein
MSSSHPILWSDPVPSNEAHARASARRLYNGVRQTQAMVRVGEVVRMLNERGGFARGVQAQIARDLGVHRSTVTRDVQKILYADRRSCPTCQRWLSDKDWDRLRKEREAEPRLQDQTSAPRSFRFSQLQDGLREIGLLRQEDDLPEEGDQPDEDELPLDDDHNSMRVLDPWHRAYRVVELLQDRGFARGAQTEIAKQLGVSRATVTRDKQRILGANGANCPTCERWMGRKDWDRLRAERGSIPRDSSA